MRFRLLTIAALLAGSSSAFAHRLIVDPRVVGGQIRVEAFYEDDTPAQEAKILIRLGDQVIAEGRTDEKGVWTCPLPKPGAYTVRAVSGGHAATRTLTVLEPEQAAAAPPSDDDRGSRTGTQWARLAAGLAIIGGLWLGWRVSRRATVKVDRTA
jgi:nickel transport protein